MWKVTITGLLSHKMRLALTAIAIVLGVTFIAGTYILTDTLNNTISGIFNDVYQHIDFQVRGVAEFSGSGGAAVRNPIPDSILPRIQQIPGVEAAGGSVSGYAQFVAKDGKPITSATTTLGFEYNSNPGISQLRVVQGTAPTTPDDVTMDAGTARSYHFKVGDHVRVLFASSSRIFTITGITHYGNANNLAGATMAAFTLPAAQSLLGLEGEFDDINIVTAPNANKADVQKAIVQVLPAGVEVVTGQTVANEQSSAINQSLSVFRTVLLVFAFVSIFVGAFTILNTFSIIVSQRTHELALLRVVGASGRQVFFSVLGEAAIVGLVSSLIGIGLGVLAALGLRDLLRAFGISLPSGPLAFEARTVVVALLVGVGATVVAAIGPARRAVRIPPIAALSRRPETGEVSLRRRFIGGITVFLLGCLGLGFGLSRSSLELVGIGALLIFIGATMLAPAIARPLAGTIGRPFGRLFGEAGKLGRENSMRDPSRTAQTASALMIGLALVSAIAVFGASLSKSTTSSVKNAISADLIISPSSSGRSGSFSAGLPKAVSSVPGVTASTTVYAGQFEFRQSVSTLKAVDPAGLARTVILHLTAGNVQTLSGGQLLIDSTTANNDHLSVGDSVPVKFAKTGPDQMRIGGIFQPNALIGSYLIGDSYYLTHYQNPLPGAILLKTNGDPGVESAVKRVLAAYPNVQVQSRSEFENAQLAQVNELLGLVYALLGLAVIIALIGIVNTLMLSVFERTREIGLLHAVGMLRGQIRAMIRTESVILAIFGAVIGIIIGTGLGVALVDSLKSQGINQMSIPVTELIVFLVLAAILGLLAAGWPARRAANLDVLAAIAAE